jgi:hypothetical protein
MLFPESGLSIGFVLELPLISTPVTAVGAKKVAEFRSKHLNEWS